MTKQPSLLPPQKATAFGALKIAADLRSEMPNPTRRRSRSAMTPTKKPAIAFLSISLLSVLVVFFLILRGRSLKPLSSDVSESSAATSRRHLLFAVASSARSRPDRRSYVRLWHSPNSTRALVFLDRNETLSAGDPPAVVSGDTSRFSYSFPGGLPSAVRVARVVKEAVELTSGDEVRWYVFGDDDTVFFVENLARTLAKYDHERWFYVGTISESYDQNSRNLFGMAFGGGGFAVSASLARALAGVLDSCLLRYAHLYGSDARVYSCVAELGVGLTHEPGFHQVDVRGNLLGLLSAHPLSPILSLHHLDAVDPIFPDTTNRTEALERLFQAADVDPARVLQQTVCYDSSRSLTVSVAWGYAIQVFEGNKLLIDLLSVQKTFTTWRRGFNYGTGYYMFNTRDNPRDACKRPAVYYLQSVESNDGDVQSNYAIYNTGKCPKSNAIKNLKHIRVSSQKLELDIEDIKALRRQCCDILPDFDESMVINIRKCRANELISMQP